MADSVLSQPLEEPPPPCDYSNGLPSNGDLPSNGGLPSNGHYFLPGDQLDYTPELLLSSLPRHLSAASPRRKRTITMDSEDAEQVPILEDLVYDGAPDAGAATLAKLNTMRRAERFCDVTLKVGSRNIPAHRAVLACASSYLFELFSSEERNGQNQYYQLDDLQPKCVDILVDYAYTGRLEVPREHVKAVYKTATLLKMQEAAEACSRFMADNLSTTNCLGTRSFANSHCDGDLTCKTDEYIQQNMGSIVGTPEMQTLPTIQIEIIGVTMEELKDHGERHLASMVVTWLEQAQSERNFQALCEDRQVLYLTSDNNLRDCLDIAEDDSTLSQDDLIQDYKKLGKRKKMVPVKAKASLEKSRSAALPQNNGMKRLSSNEKLASFEKEWKVIASELVGDQTCFCVAMLEDRMTVLSLAFRPYPATPPASTHGGGPAEPASPSYSPRGSLNTLLLEKQCSLQPLAPMLNPRCALGTAVLDGKLVALGGYDRGECLGAVEQYEHAGNRWRALAAMTEARGRFDASLVAGKIYAVGGSDGSRELNTVECYDPEADKWSMVAKMKYRRSNAGVTTLKGLLYVVGGWSGTSGMRECEKYDPATDEWTSIAKLNIGRSQAGVCALEDGRLVAIGGCDAWNPMNSVEVYDPEDDKWTHLPNMNTNRRGLGAAVFKGKLYAVGGSDGTSSLASVECLEAGGNVWTFCPSLSVPRANVSVAVVRNRLYAVGGFSGKAFLDSMEYLQGGPGQDWCSFVPVKDTAAGGEEGCIKEEDAATDNTPEENGEPHNNSKKEREEGGKREEDETTATATAKQNGDNSKKQDSEGKKEGQEGGKQEEGESKEGPNEHGDGPRENGVSQ